MKIKTITCHDVYNHGATLQAYALVACLKKMGHDVEIIDYLPSYLRIRTHLLSVSSNWIDRPWFWKLAYLVGKMPFRLIWPLVSCKKSFDSFNKKYLRVTSLRYRSYKALQRNPPEADVYLAGSDQIWNTSYQNGRDPAFFLDFGPNSIRRVSYAASFGTEQIDDRFVVFVQEQLKRFDAISVRETAGSRILDSLGFVNTQVCDPVFLLNTECWDRLASSGETPVGPYILIYDFENSASFGSFAREVAKKLGMPIYSVNNYSKCSYADKDFYKTGPETFLFLIKNAELVISNSFHATAFSIIFKTKFFVVPRVKDKVNSRMESLLNLAGLGDRLLSKASIDNPDFIFPLMSYTCNEQLDQMIKDSKRFLEKHVLMSDENHPGS